MGNDGGSGASDDERTYTAFADDRLLVSGRLPKLLTRTKEHLDGGGSPVLIFDDETGHQIDFDFRGSLDAVLGRALPSKRKAGPGRPKLGVVSREVSLLPRHWEWLEAQQTGISAALRRLVDEARKREPDKERARRSRDAAGAFMWGMAGDRPGFEEASRALFSGDRTRFESLVSEWPTDIRQHLLQLARRGPGGDGPEGSPGD